jgi:undecaprenyl diphosphate synthase
MQKIPQHIAIIMDGNGRWALQRNLPRVEGHRQGVRSVRTVIESCLSHQVPVLSLFAFSSENWKRPVEEVDFLMQLFVESVEQEIEELHAAGVSLRFIGDCSALSELLQLTIQSVETLTANNQALRVNIMINYGGRWDILNTTKKIARLVQAHQIKETDISEALFTQLLATEALPEPDLLIRTSGELRISNFMLWQLAYSELYFTETMWPDFDKLAFEKALSEYALRKRRYGKINEQFEVESDA